MRIHRAIKTARSANRAVNRAVLATACCLCVTGAWANPVGGVPASGAVTIQATGSVLQITNSPSAIINWQSFSISAGEITRFIQQSSASAVLNRVTGVKLHGVTTIDPSLILGSLQSNGRVFLVNPSGIIFGAGSSVDVAGLIATSLDLSNSDFQNGRMRFGAVTGAGAVVNNGSVTTTSGGSVYLVGPAVTNGGIITSPAGEVILAAGNSVELVNPGTPSLSVVIDAPDNVAVNLGQIIAVSGRVGIYAGIIRQNGTINANTAVVGTDGSIQLKATKDTTLEAGSVTTANGPDDGTVKVKSGGSSGGSSDPAATTGAVAETEKHGGTIEIESGDTSRVDGVVEAKGSGADGLAPLPSPGGRSLDDATNTVVASTSQLTVVQQTQATNAATTLAIGSTLANPGKKKSTIAVCGAGDSAR